MFDFRQLGLISTVSTGLGPARWLLAAGCIVAAISAQNPGTQPQRTLTRVAELRALSPEDARQRYPVRLRGVVTLVFVRGAFFLQDDTGGVLLSPANRNGSSLAPGDLLEVVGHSDFGAMVPRVRPASWRVLGKATLPEPVRISADDLAAGLHISEWVQLEGIVRAANAGTERTCILRLDTGAQVVEAQLVEGTVEAGRALVDSKVRVRGVVGGYANERRQFTGLYVRVASMDYVEVLKPPPSDPFALPTTPVTALMTFSPHGYSAHRMKVRGTVLGHDSGRALYLRDRQQGLVVFCEQTDALAPGDVVEVAGFPEMGPTSPRLHDGIFRRIEKGPAPAPLEVGPDTLLRGLLDGELVAIEARLVSVAHTMTDTTLVLDSGGTVIQARLDSLRVASPSWTAGSRLRVSGICRVERAQLPTVTTIVTARDVGLWLRGPSDVSVLQPAPWWTTTRLLIVVAIAASIALVALAWGVMLRRRVRVQTEIIRAKIQNETVADERQRIAREFHDTLEQELAGLAVRLDTLPLTAGDAGNGAFVSALQRLAHRLQDEARHFIWNLRERRWENTTLADALADAVAERHADDTVKIEFTSEGQQERLPGVVSHHLLRVGQEAVANAVQHAAATCVRVRLQFQPDTVTLLIEDDGRGFDVETASGRRAGHFGLVGMRERARRMGAELELCSAKGRGTNVAVRLKLSDFEKLHEQH